ncbi:MAG: FxsA family protein [Desulfatibacillaceae bacterium]
MFTKLFLAFTIIPVVEIYVLIKVGGIIGAGPTVAIVVVTGAVGAYMARTQGMRTMRRVRDSLYSGDMPADDLIDALLIFAAGVVLLTPGFFTDATGLFLLFPPTRVIVRKQVRQRFDHFMQQQNPNYPHHF